VQFNHWVQEDGGRIERGFQSYEGGGFDLRLVVEWAGLTACLFKKILLRIWGLSDRLRDVSLLLFFLPVE
jgi:hypothetical protein